MKLRIRSSLLGNARFGLVVGLALASGVGCSDDDSVPDFPAPDGGGTESTATMDESSTGGGGNNTDETAATSDTSSADTLTVNPDTSTGSTTGGETSVPTDSSEPGTDTTDVMTTAPTSDIVDSHTTDLTLPTSEPMSSADTQDTSGIVVDGPISPPDDMVVISNFDSQAGFQDGQHNLNGADVTRTYADSMMTLEVPFSGADQQTGVNFNYAGSICGYDILARVRLRSGLGAPGGVQMRVWSGNWGVFASKLGNVGQAGVWTEYRMSWSDVVDNNANLDIGAINAVGVAFLSFGNATAATFDVDWIGLVPSDVPCPEVPDSGTNVTDVTDTTTPPDETTEMMPDGGVDASSTEPVDTTDEMTDPDASVTTDVVTTDVVTSDVQTSDATDGPIDPPVGISLITSFEDLQTVGFTQSDLEETFTAGASIGTLTVPFTQGGNQEAQLAFGISGDYCGYELVARVRLVSGFNVSGTAPGGVQLRVWSDNWGQFAGNWTTLNAVGDGNQLGEWVEYRFDMADAAAENASLNIGALNAAGIAFITGGDVEDAYSTSVFEIDWVGFEPTGAGCP